MNSLISETQVASVKNQRLNNFSKRIILIGIIAVLGFFAYQKLSFTENVARETANRFFYMMVNQKSNTLREIYPTLNFYRIVFENPCTINNVSKNSDGDYEVYATYAPNKVYSYPITLVVGKENSEVTIKSSRGISYAYYDKVLDYGKKKGCITGEEDDFQLEEIIKQKRLRTYLVLNTDFRLEELQNNLKSRANLKPEWGYIKGDVTVTNKNNFDLNYSDLDCRVEFYDSAGRITASDNVLITKLPAFSSATGSVWSDINNSTSYKVVTNIKITDDLKSRVKDLIISEESYDCN